ncbi:MAG: hypothetical protein UT24_C0012G0132 [Candidatus Woesebacteria bacterium GW2011_GWB1_39_12]|uniref:DNA-directed DNA polymerase n=2 Tax=Candidatus Woeseibacteriota TaxID=1752722 RepID=A0A0G0Q782_9BACT|nr:MAG: hypothetical protein UT23_C0011G0007 [Candidatus Woesebacteria bacterium GW2011_GWA1_39_12]KKR00510.1 MAG: hypothetical protein UT24_C0012G0132 [Candidatus Woesebacteria bacterium GW2011_GWB1_39_12]
MKIIILHGDNTLESYERLQKFIDNAQSRSWEITRISNASQNIPEALVSTSLFDKEKFVVIENANLINKTTANWLKKNGSELNLTLIIYNQGILSQTFLKQLPKIDKVEEFKLPKLIWSFLDSCFPGNAKNALLLLHEIIKNEPVEFVFSLLAKHLRDLYWVKVDSPPGQRPSGPVAYPSWRVEKLKRQSHKFSEGSLEDLINSLAQADIKAKTSQGELIDLLDFIIATKLE